MVEHRESVSEYDSDRLSSEVGSYQEWLDLRTQEVYDIALQAKAKGLDFSTEIEIPRAADLASRTEKLLEEYLKGLEIEDDLRAILLKTDRESASIQIAVNVAKRMYERDGDLREAIDCGLRVGLAVLTEAVLELHWMVLVRSGFSIIQMAQSFFLLISADQ